MVVARTAAEMQLADRDDAMPGVAQCVVPARDRAFVAVGVVPVADLVHVAADGECRPRRYADRAGRVRCREARAARGKRIEVGRGDERMAGGPEKFRIVLVGHEHEHVGGAHAGKYRTAARAGLRRCAGVTLAAAPPRVRPRRKHEAPASHGPAAHGVRDLRAGCERADVSEPSDQADRRRFRRWRTRPTRAPRHGEAFEQRWPAGRRRQPPRRRAACWAPNSWRSRRPTATRCC